jgi:membrane associated rhomboid family serine protease
MDINLNPGDYQVGDAKDDNSSKKTGNNSSFFAQLKNKSLTIIIIALNVLFFFLADGIKLLDPRLDDVARELNTYRVRVIVQGQVYAFPFNRDTVFNYSYASSYSPLIKQENQFYRFLSATYQHAGLWHLAINMFSLFLIGRFFEGMYGKMRFFVIYTIAGFASTLFSFFSNFSFTFTTSVGASGSLFGLIGALLAFALLSKDRLDPGYRKSLLNNLLFIIGLNLVIGFTVSGVDNIGHIGGLIGGLGAAFFIQPQIFLGTHKTEKDETAVMKVFFYLTIAAVVFSICVNFYYYFSGKAFEGVKNVFKKRSSQMVSPRGQEQFPQNSISPENRRTAPQSGDEI